MGKEEGTGTEEKRPLHTEWGGLSLFRKTSDDLRFFFFCPFFFSTSTGYRDGTETTKATDDLQFLKGEDGLKTTYTSPLPTRVRKIV